LSTAALKFKTKLVSCYNAKVISATLFLDKMKKSWNRILVVAMLVFFTTSCSIPWLPFSNSSSKGVLLLSDSHKSIAKEPTAFQPFYPTLAPTNALQPINDALVPNPGLVPPEGQVNIVVLGSDERYHTGYRTDVVLLVSVYTKEDKVSLVSFPRDLYVEISEHAAGSHQYRHGIRWISFVGFYL
jgi:anionic cell wall polymer biosynthesis LytR-Cps2A-Psr (LCP) family protein